MTRQRVRGVTEGMTRRLILISSGLSLTFLVLSILVPGITLAATSNIPAAVLSVSFVFLMLGCVVGAAVWVGGLIKTAAGGNWGWFVAILIFNVVGTLAYGIRQEALADGPASL
jgi:hypothetical protein